MNYETLIYNKKNDIATVTMNRPDVRNALNEVLIKELTHCFNHISDDDSIIAVILTGNGKSFCAGADLLWMKRMVNYSKHENLEDSNLLLEMYEAVNTCSKPVIGRINGHTFGGGIGLLATCDITITIPGVQFAFSEVKLGIIPAVISTFVATRMKLADMRRYFITGERFDSDMANIIGLIDFIVPVEKLDETVNSYIEQLCSSSPSAIKEVKDLIYNFKRMDIKKYKEFTVEKISELRISKEGQEGISAFLEKRKPNWKRKKSCLKKS